LVVDGFDVEQIWEELQLQNIPLLKLLGSSVSTLVATRNLRLPNAHTDDEGSNIESNVEDEDQFSIDQDDEVEDGDLEFDDEDDDNEDNDEELDTKQKASGSDMFFNAEDMEDWLDAEDEKEQGENEDEPTAEELAEEGDDSDLPKRYQDFFDPVQSKPRIKGYDEFDVPLEEALEEDEDLEDIEDADGSELEDEDSLDQLKEKLGVMEEEEGNQDISTSKFACAMKLIHKCLPTKSACKN
jgi:U3 small nucleolar RNA-associated protein MPP10